MSPNHHVHLDVGDPAFRVIFPDGVDVTLPPDSTVLEALCRLDQRIHARADPPPQYQFGAKFLLQSLYNPETGEFFEDVCIESRGPGGEFLPLRAHPREPLPDQSSVFLWPDAGC